jgi:hypothetical protein
MRIDFLPRLLFNITLNPGTGGVTVHSDTLTLLNGNVSSLVDIEVAKIAFGDVNIARHVSNAFPLPVTTNTKNTYRGSPIALLVTATTASVPFLILQGSATKTLKLQSILLSGITTTAVGYQNIGCAKYSTAPTGGTATTLVKVPLDSTTSASTANLCQVYTVGPTAGTKVGDIGCRRQLAQATTAAAAGIPEEILFDFSNNKDGGTGVLRGTAEGIGLYWITAPASAPSLLVRIEWCEE